SRDLLRGRRNPRIRMVSSGAESDTKNPDLVKPPPEPGTPVMLGTDPKRKPVGGDGDSGGERRAAVQLPVYIKAHRLAVIGRRDMDPPAVNRRGIGLRGQPVDVAIGRLVDTEENPAPRHGQLIAVGGVVPR